MAAIYWAAIARDTLTSMASCAPAATISPMRMLVLLWYEVSAVDVADGV